MANPHGRPGWPAAAPLDAGSIAGIIGVVSKAHRRKGHPVKTIYRDTFAKPVNLYPQPVERWGCDECLLSGYRWEDTPDDTVYCQTTACRVADDQQHRWQLRAPDSAIIRRAAQKWRLGHDRALDEVPLHLRGTVLAHLGYDTVGHAAVLGE
jgi:hypothetical protein